MEELQVVTTLAVLQHLIKFVGDFKGLWVIDRHYAQRNPTATST
jgi:hypothetical protein